MAIHSLTEGILPSYEEASVSQKGAERENMGSWSAQTGTRADPRRAERHGVTIREDV